MRTIVTILACLFFGPGLSAAEETTLITPCRLLDTRNSGGIVVAGSERSFSVRGDAGHTQGGDSRCGVPEDATGVLMNVIAVGAVGPGHLQVHRYGVYAATTSRVNYDSLGNVANEIVVRMADPVFPYDLTMRASTSAVHVVVDVMGFMHTSGAPYFEVRGMVIAHGSPSGLPPYFLTLDLDPSTSGCSGSECAKFECTVGGEVDCLIVLNGQCGRVLANSRSAGLPLLHALYQEDCPQ